MESKALIYLDYQATTPVDPRVLDAMLPYFGGRFANASSVQHAAGREASAAVEAARERVADSIGADRREIVFCSGATEADALALKGLVGRSGRDRLVVLATEHSAVLESARSLERDGCDVVELAVDSEGLPSLARLKEVVDERTLLVSVAAANNEIGTLPPLAAIAHIAHEVGAYFHSDAAQAVGKIDIDVDRDEIDLLSISGHKLYGPMGIGALYVRREVQSSMTSQLDGGGHERGLRSGTLNVPGIVGLAAALDLALDDREGEAERLRALVARLLLRIQEGAGEVVLNGPIHRLPGNLNLHIRGVDAEALMANCPQLAFSAGSACAAATPTPSHVLTAIGLDEEAAEHSVRLGVGRPTTQSEVDRAAAAITAAVRRIRAATGGREPVPAR